MSFSTVAGPNLGQHPTFDPGSSLLWELSRLKVAQGGRRPTAVLNDIAPSAVMCGLVAESVGPTLGIGIGPPMWWPAAVYVLRDSSSDPDGNPAPVSLSTPGDREDLIACFGLRGPVYGAPALRHRATALSPMLGARMSARRASLSPAVSPLGAWFQRERSLALLTVS